LAKVMLPNPKRRKIGYAKHIATYKFLAINSNIIEYNAIVETKNIEFFKHIFP